MKKQAHPRLSVALDREVDGRWIAEVSGAAAAHCYGSTREEALAKARALVMVLEGLYVGDAHAPDDFEG